jgi:hypothetical protein
MAFFVIDRAVDGITVLVRGHTAERGRSQNGVVVPAQQFQRTVAVDVNGVIDINIVVRVQFQRGSGCPGDDVVDDDIVVSLNRLVSSQQKRAQRGAADAAALGSDEVVIRGR